MRINLPMMITDRTKTDVLLGTEKGRYNYEDLNRVERMVQYLSELTRKLDACRELTTKTDWYFPDRFDARQWPTREQMVRYLDNVSSLCDAVGVVCQLPASMDKLTWEGANDIEKALVTAHERIAAVLQAFAFSGELFAGEEEL
jgi:hypothetical protein